MCSCILKIISLVKNYFKISRVHLKFSNEEFRVTKSEAVIEVLIKTGVFRDVTPCRIACVCVCVCVCIYIYIYIYMTLLPTFLSNLLLPSWGLSQKPFFGLYDTENWGNILFWKAVTPYSFAGRNFPRFEPWKLR